MTAPIVIVDYGLGNLFNVSCALEYVGATPRVSRDPQEISTADKIIIPGVGAFGEGMEGLRSRQLVEPLRRAAARGASILGICLGMQLLAEAGEEFGEHEGLGLIPGRVVRLPDTRADGTRIRLPHVGWSALRRKNGADWSESPLTPLHEGTMMYFVHSFVLRPVDENVTLAVASYEAAEFSSVVRCGNIIGCQFHPERSGDAGLSVLREFTAGKTSARA